MAAKKTKQIKKTEDSGKEKRKRFSFLYSMTPEKKVRLLKFLALAVGVFMYFRICGILSFHMVG